MEKQTERHRSVFPVGILILAGILIIIFLATIFTAGDKGLFNLLSLKDKVADLRMDINKLERDNRRLKSRIKDLRQNPRYIERVAREELGLAFPEERIYLYDTTAAARAGKNKSDEK